MAYSGLQAFAFGMGVIANVIVARNVLQEITEYRAAKRAGNGGGGADRGGVGGGQNIKQI